MRIFLDDERFPKVEKFDIIIRSYESLEYLVRTLGKRTINYISFDHDLGEGLNGYDCVKFLVNRDLECQILADDFTFNVHSANPVGSVNIRKYMEGYLCSR
jgi:hypothetical protein